MKRPAGDNNLGEGGVESPIQDLIVLLTSLIKSKVFGIFFSEKAAEMKKKLEHISPETVPGDMKAKFKELTKKFRTEAHDFYRDLLETTPQDDEYFDGIIKLITREINTLDLKIDALLQEYNEYLSTTRNVMSGRSTLIPSGYESDEVVRKISQKVIVDYTPVNDIIDFEILADVVTAKNNFKKVNSPPPSLLDPEFLEDILQWLEGIFQGERIDLPQDKKQKILSFLQSNSIEQVAYYLDQLQPEVVSLTVEIASHVGQIGKEVCIAQLTEETQLAKKETRKPTPQARIGLNEEFNRFIKEALKLPQTLIVTEAVANGGCFFDSLAQTLDLQGKMNEKLLRLSCYEYYTEGSNKAKIDDLNQEDCRRKDSDQIQIGEYPLMQYTQEEMDIFFKGFNRTAFWGRTHVEGPILCDKLGLKSFMVIELITTESDRKNADSKRIIPSYVFVTSKGVETLDIEIDKNRIRSHLKERPTLVTDGRHFVPVTSYFSEKNIEKVLYFLQRIIFEKYIVLTHKEKENLIDHLESFGESIVSGQIRIADKSGNIAEIQKLILDVKGVDNIIRFCHARVQVNELKENPGQLLFVEKLSLSQVLEKGYTLHRLLSDGISLQFLLENKTDLSQLTDAGIGKEEFLKAGMDAIMLVKKYDKKGPELLACGFTVEEMCQNGLTAKKIYDIGVPYRQFREVFNESLEVYGIRVNNRFSWWKCKENFKEWDKKFGKELMISLSILEFLTHLPDGCHQFMPFIMKFMISINENSGHNLENTAPRPFT